MSSSLVSSPKSHILKHARREVGAGATVSPSVAKGVGEHVLQVMRGKDTIAAAQPEATSLVEPLPYAVFEPYSPEARKAHLREIGRTQQRPAVIGLNRNQPVATAKTVQEVLGMDVGALLAIVYLPAPKGGFTTDQAKLLRFYVFDTSQRAASDEVPNKPQVMLASHAQLEQIHAHAQTKGQVEAPKTGEAMPILHPGQARVIGQNQGNWLPPGAVRMSYDDAGSSNVYNRVSPHQLTVGVSWEGDITLRDALSDNGTSILTGHIDGPLIDGRPADPWQTFPVDVDPHNPLSMPGQTSRLV